MTATAALLAAGSAQAAPSDSVTTELEALRAMVVAQQARLEAQERRLYELEQRPIATNDVAQLAPPRLIRASQQVEPIRVVQAGPATDIPDQPVGEAPPASVDDPVLAPARAALPEGMTGVLTADGGLVVEPSVEYGTTTSNRLVFRGVEIVAGVLVGAIEANDSDRQTLASTLTARYGLSSRWEIEGRLPFLYRSDRIVPVPQPDGDFNTIDQEGSGIGDFEAAVRYQLNDARLDRPVFIASLRAKSDTGVGPFEVDRNQFGVADELATGSGFWSIQPGISFLLPTDPAVIFGNLAYLYNVEDDVDKTFGTTTIGKVDPGDAISAALGFGFALNPRFSFSLGYVHNYIFETTSEINGLRAVSEPLTAGSALFGLSYRLNDRFALSTNFEFGVTADAPDMRVVLRLPYAF